MSFLDQMALDVLAAGRCRLGIEVGGPNFSLVYDTDGGMRTVHPIRAFTVGLGTETIKAEATPEVCNIIRRLCLEAQPVFPEGSGDRLGGRSWTKGPGLVIEFDNAWSAQEYLYPITGIDWWHPDSYEDVRLTDVGNDAIIRLEKEFAQVVRALGRNRVCLDEAALVRHMEVGDDKARKMLAPLWDKARPIKGDPHYRDVRFGLVPMTTGPSGRVGFLSGRYDGSDGLCGVSFPYVAGSRGDILAPHDGFDLYRITWETVELRLAANLSGEGEWIRAFWENEDMHEVTARRVLGLSEPPTKEQRHVGKMLNYAYLYDGNPDPHLDLSVWLPRMSEMYPTLTAWMGSLERRSLVTPYGRNIRTLPESRLIPTAAVLQATTVDMLKHAMVLLHKTLHAKGWLRAGGDDSVRLLPPVHDTIVVEVRRDRSHEVRDMVRDYMSNVPALAQGGVDWPVTMRTMVEQRGPVNRGGVPVDWRRE